MPSAPHPALPLVASVLRDHLRGRAVSGLKEIPLAPEILQKLAGGAAVRPVPALAPAKPAFRPAAPAPIPAVRAAAPVILPSVSAAPALPLEEKILRLEALRGRVASDPNIRALAGGALNTTFVFSVGDPMARLMIVGEAPGHQEERDGAPFVGPAGQLLDKMLRAMGLGREQVYIANVVKLRPRVPGGAPTENRPPVAEEIAPFRPFILEEIALVRPGVILALGITAVQGLLGVKDSMARLRSRFHDLDGIPVMPTYHPAYLLRNTAVSEKRKVWEDLLQVMERLEMPITERQRQFFAPTTGE